MRLLYVHGSSVIPGIIVALQRINVDVVVYPKRQTDIFLNEIEVEELVQYIKEYDITHMMSVHLIDNLAAAADRTDVKYISVIWDAPYFNLFTKYGRMKNCYFSVFDKLDCKRFAERGIKHVLYQPLAVNDAMIREWDDKRDDIERHKYSHEICFIGSLYEGNFYDEYCQNLPQMLQEYFISIFQEAAFKWDGINRVYGSVSEELLAYMRKTIPDFQMVNFLKYLIHCCLKMDI